MGPNETKRVASPLTPGLCRRNPTQSQQRVQENKNGIYISDTEDKQLGSVFRAQRPLTAPVRAKRRRCGFDLSDEDEDLLNVDPDDLLPWDDSSDSDSSSENDDENTSEPVGSSGGNANQIFDRNKKAWRLNPFPDSKRRKSAIVQKKIGPRGDALLENLNPADIFKLFFSPEMVQTIMDYTNANGIKEVERSREVITEKRNQGAQVRKKLIPDWKFVEEEEFYGFIGVLLLAGVEKRKHEPVSELWSSNSLYGHPSIFAAMSRERFVQIQRNMRFDNAELRRARKNTDSPLPALTPIMEIFDPFVQKIQANFAPGLHLTVDEMLLKYSENKRFCVRKTKPEKYGVKVWVVVDAETGYVLGMKLYQGKVVKAVKEGLGKKVVLELCEKYFGSGRGVTCGNFFTSVSLAETLLANNMTLLGIINKKRMEVPLFMATPNGKEVYSSHFAYQEGMTMVCYVPKKHKTLVLLSTQHHGNEISDTPKKKPKMIMDYDGTKCGMDVADEMVGSYSCQRNTRRWPMKIFYAMLDVAGLNSYIIWRMHHKLPRTGSRRNFLRELCEGLIKPSVLRRSLEPSANQLPSHIKTAMKKMGAVFPEPQLSQNESPAMKGKCYVCPGNARQKKDSRIRCFSCNKFACGTHSRKILICNGCDIISLQPMATGTTLQDVEDFHEELGAEEMNVDNYC